MPAHRQSTFLFRDRRVRVEKKTRRIYLPQAQGLKW